MPRAPEEALPHSPAARLPDPARFNDELCNNRFEMIQRQYGTSAAYIVMGLALKEMGRTPGVVSSPHDFAMRLLMSAERAIFAEGYDIPDDSGRLRLTNPDFNQYWDQVFDTDLQTTLYTSDTDEEALTGNQ